MTHRPCAVALAMLAFGAAAWTPGAAARPPLSVVVRSLDGSANNLAHPSWGQAGTPYIRAAPAAYADSTSAQAGGPNPRYISNRIFNDIGQNLFSEHNLTQWGVDVGPVHGPHVRPRESAGSVERRFRSTARIRSKRSATTSGRSTFSRDAAAPGTGTSAQKPRQEINTVSSYIDAWSVYGGTGQRLEWLREGPVDGNLADNGPRLCCAWRLPAARHGPRRCSDARPRWTVDGQLQGHPQDAVVAGDVRANENIALTADAHAVRARAQPDREPAPSCLGVRAAASRSPGGWWAPSSSSSPTASS